MRLPAPALASALGLLALARVSSAQITAVGPFTGSDSEPFETQPNGQFTPCVIGRVFNNKGDLCTPGNSNAHITTGWGFYCSIFPHGGGRLFGSAGGYAEYAFDTPVQRFGGWFGTNSGAANGTAKFFDSTGALLGTQTITAPNNCTWTWNGWDAGAGPQFKSVQVVGNDPGGNGGFIMMDDMQIDSAPASGIYPYCFGDGTVAGLAPCPCGNSGASGRGCQNSSFSGGALLSGTGTTSPDTVVLTSSGEIATSPSVFFQGDASMAGGSGFGDGVRCVAGVMKRLYTKNAVAGVVSAPTGSDPSITVRSAALGVPISPGATRYYQVWYADSSSTYCPAPLGNVWNGSNALQIVW